MFIYHVSCFLVFIPKRSYWDYSPKVKGHVGYNM